jgi:hypothetical protein
MVLRRTCPPGELLGQRYSRLGRCPHKGAFWSEQRIVLSLLHGAQLFIGFDDGRDGWKGDCGDGQVLVEATRAVFWWSLVPYQMGNTIIL